MPISLQCPGCGQRLKANDNLAGRRLPCPKCRQEIQVPERKVEDEAAALLLEGESETPAAPPAFTTSPFATAPQVPTKPSPAPAASMPPLKSNEPPLWLRHLHWLLVLALIPLAMSLLQKQSREDDIVQRLDDTIENASPEDQRRIVRLLETKERVDLDDILTALPRERLQGAALSRNSHWHWAFAAAATALFLGFFVLLATGGVADPRHLLGVGLFTGTIGILFLLIVQALAEWTQGVWPHGRSILVIFIYIAKLIGLSYRAALDPENGFWVSFIGFTAGVGLCEEVCKAVPVLWHLRRNPDEGWRGAFLWGLASGAGFGIAEGVIYSANYYNGITGSGIYVVRFISCVALHAVWTGSVAITIQQKPHWLLQAERWHDFVAPVLVYIAVPMVLHGLYDTLLKKDMNSIALVVAVLSFGYLAYRISRLHGADDAAATEELLREYKKRRKSMT
ncbi:MAG TPA: PrsW family glutamic-type intramembrane protease [Gemmataceae bacterium]|nr:PrsW family glutamic-type intramembrane protease [Gemmataceae bacterium]